MLKHVKSLRLSLKIVALAHLQGLQTFQQPTETPSLKAASLKDLAGRPTVFRFPKAFFDRLRSGKWHDFTWGKWWFHHFKMGKTMGRCWFTLLGSMIYHFVDFPVSNLMIYPTNLMMSTPTTFDDVNHSVKLPVGINQQVNESGGRIVKKEGEFFWRVSNSPGKYICWLVVKPPLWKIYILVSWDDEIPNIWENKIHGNQTVPNPDMDLNHSRKFIVWATRNLGESLIPQPDSDGWINICGKRPWLLPHESRWSFKEKKRALNAIPKIQIEIKSKGGAPQLEVRNSHWLL